MEKKKKILYVINDLKRGGAQVVIYHVARMLSKETYEVTVAYLYTHSNVPTIEQELAEAGIITVALCDEGKKSLWHATLNLFTYIKTARPSVVHCHLPDATIAGAVAGLCARVPTIFVHEHNTHAFFSWKINTLLSLLRPWLSLTICYSETVEQELFGAVHMLSKPPDVFPKKSCTILNGVDIRGVKEAYARKNTNTLRAQLGIAADAPLVLSVARLVAWKGQKELMCAFARVASLYPAAVLVLVGDGGMREELTKLKDELGIGARVYILGARNDVFDFLAIADIYSAVYQYPPEAKGKGEESIGIATLEAMGAGLPAIAADYPSAYKFITPGANGLLAKPGDTDDLSEKLKELLSDAEKRTRLGSASRAFVEQTLAWESLIAIYEKLYSMVA